MPDAAFVALTSDEKRWAAAVRKRNAQERGGQGQLSEEAVDLSNEHQRLVTDEVAGRSAAARTPADVAWAAQRYRTLQGDDQTVRARRAADAWCAAFLGPKKPGSAMITTDTVHQAAAGTLDAGTADIVDALATEHRLFHWHLEFPEIFRVGDGLGPAAGGWSGGFSAVLGNPPWETVQMSEKEFFASRDPRIAEASNAAARKRLIVALEQENPALHAEFVRESVRLSAQNHLVRDSGRYPLCAAGKVNTYSLFAEHFRDSLARTGRSGIITPTGLATDATTAPFFADTVRSGRLAAFYDFENEAKIFSGVDHRVRFAVSSMTGGESADNVRLSFLNRHVREAEERRFALAPEEVLLLNPNTGTLPIFRTRRDADITLACYRRHPILIRDGHPDGNPWSLAFSQGLFNMASDAGLFRTADDLEEAGATFDGWAWHRGDDRWLPLYEAKMLSHWNHRFSTYAGATQAQLNVGSLPRLTERELDDWDAESRARYWVASTDVDEAVPDTWDRGWFLGWRDIARASDVRTFVPSVLPRSAVGHVFPVVAAGQPSMLAVLAAVWGSLVFDYITRQKLSGTHMTYGAVKQLAMPTPGTLDESPAWSKDSWSRFLRSRIVELSYTSHRIRPYAEDVVGGDPGAPFRWLPDRRAQLTAEIDAAMLHLYGLDRDDAEHVLDSFVVLRKYEERDHGEFRIKRLVLAAYDAMAEAAKTGVAFVSPLDPPPGHGPRHDGAAR